MKKFPYKEGKWRRRNSINFIDLIKELDNYIDLFYNTWCIFRYIVRSCGKCDYYITRVDQEKIINDGIRVLDRYILI